MNTASDNDELMERLCEPCSGLVDVGFPPFSNLTY